jgi:hypothetical protein
MNEVHDVHQPPTTVIDSGPEAELTREIADLWAVHVQTQQVVGKTKEELKSLRDKLGERLYQMKLLLVRPGRNGGWRSFLQSHGIARPTADRLVTAHAQSLRPDELNVLSEQIPAEPTEAQLGKLVAQVWNRAEAKLPSARSRYDFLRCLAGRAGLTVESCQDGVVVREPGVKRNEIVPAPQEVVVAIEPQSEQFAEVL